MKSLKYFRLIFLVIVIFRCSHAILDEFLISSFFAAKYCTMGSVFSCATKQEQLKLVKGLCRRGLRVSSFDVTRRNFSTTEVLERRFNNHLAVIIDADCDNIIQFLEQCADLKFFFETYHWLAIGYRNNMTDKFNTVALTINADLSVAVPESTDDSGVVTNWTIFDVYNPAYRHGGKLKVGEIGYYNREEGYHAKIQENKYFKRRNMTGTVFNSIMVIPEKISMSVEDYLASDNDRKNNTFSRFQSVTVRNCADLYNFKNNITIMDSWGYAQPNGEIDGMVGEFQYNRTDFGNAPLMYKLYRLKAMDYGYGNWIMKSAFIFRHPKKTQTSYELYVRPLVGSVWIATMLASVLIVITLRLIIAKEVHVLPEADYSGEMSWSFLFLYTVGELCQQGFSYIPVLPSGRIVVITVLIFSFLIYQFYSASVVALLLLEPPRTINTLLDLLMSSLKTGCEDSLYDRDYLATTTDPVAIKLYNTKIKRRNNASNFLPPEEGLELVEHGGFAFHTQTSTAYPIIEATFPEKAICEMAQVEMYPTQTLYMSIPKRSPFLEMFNYCMVHQMEVGVMHRLRRHWDARKPYCIDATNYMVIEVGLEESYWALVLLAAGIFTSLMFLCIENVWSKKAAVMKERFVRKRQRYGQWSLLFIKKLVKYV